MGMTPNSLTGGCGMSPVKGNCCMSPIVREGYHGNMGTDKKSALSSATLNSNP